jgi:hypothetical protein
MQRKNEERKEDLLRLEQNVIEKRQKNRIQVELYNKKENDLKVYEKTVISYEQEVKQLESKTQAALLKVKDMTEELDKLKVLYSSSHTEDLSSTLTYMIRSTFA